MVTSILSALISRGEAANFRDISEWGLRFSRFVKNCRLPKIELVVLPLEGASSRAVEPSKGDGI